MKAAGSLPFGTNHRDGTAVRAMLASLSIRDIVLIERMDLAFEDGLCTLTGETGAGKSILLDALGLTLGARADMGLLRRGSKRAVVAAGFEINAENPLLDELEAQGLDLSDVRAGEPLILRRTLDGHGRSRAFVNDQPVSIALLRSLGDRLVEVQGQFEQRGLLDPSSHRHHLDAYAQHLDSTMKLAVLWRNWKQTEEERDAEIRLQEEASQDEAYLRHDLSELESLRPGEGEASRLAQKRTFLRNREKAIAAFEASEAALFNDQSDASAVGLLQHALKSLEGIEALMGDSVRAVTAGLGRAEAEIQEALTELARLKADFDLEGETMQEIEERYFALNDLARKHGCDPDRLPEKLDEISNRLDLLDSGNDRLEALCEAARAAREDYLAMAGRLSSERHKAAKALDAAVARELDPLKLERARFVTQIEALPESDWGEGGIDQVRFTVSTNPGQPLGPLSKIASGGELSRFLLALKVVLAELNPDQTLIFDEADSGIGGATADAVGERLARLAVGRQVLAVTHSPQVAARARHHWLVLKGEKSGTAVTEVVTLAGNERQEEIARMLSGAKVTAEARAAAARLIGGAS